ncbi:MAG TPA: hypothetical protein VLY03_03525 [Bacteroidota bacterium]|nr:hypothetical protein [Bacteroidota bacterium]
MRLTLLAFAAGVALELSGCEPATFVTEPPWTLSGRIVLNAIGGNGNNLGIVLFDLNVSEIPKLDVIPNGIEPRVSARGLELAYSGTEAGKIDIFRSDITGSGIVDLTPDSTSIDSWPDWSPDDSAVCFTRVMPYPPFREELFIVTNDALHRRIITDTAQLQTATMPRWSPDGTKIAFMGNPSGNISPAYSLYTISPDGSHALRLDDIGSMLPASLPAWAPDSRSIAYARTYGMSDRNAPQSLTDTTGGLCVVDAAAGIPEKINIQGVNVIGMGYSWLSSTELICVGESVADSLSGYGIYRALVSAPAGATFLAGGFRPVPTTVCSPDGKYVAIVGTADTSSAFALFVVGSDGKGFRKLKDIASDPKAFVNDWGDIQWIR